MELYKLILTERENDGKRLWVIFGLMNVINGALIAYIISDPIEPNFKNFLVSTLGIAVSVLWMGTSRRMIAWIQWWESKLQELGPNAFSQEDENGKKMAPDGFNLFLKRELEEEKGISTKTISFVMPLAFLLAWASILAKIGCAVIDCPC